jgi:hypothetical protein
MGSVKTSSAETSENPPARPKPTPSEHPNNVADLIARHETQCNCPVVDVPSSEELRCAAEIFQTFKCRGDSEIVDPVHLNWAIQELAKISDKWIDPEQDPVCLDAYNFLETSIDQIGETLDEVSPESKEPRERWANLRVLNHCIKRTMRRKELNPSRLTVAWRKLFRRK